MAVQACCPPGDGSPGEAACISTDPDNQIAEGADGCLYVPPGAGAVTTGCGVTGNGSTADPIAATVSEWPAEFPCDVSNGMPIYCDPATGLLHTEPRHYSLSVNTNENHAGPFDLTTGETPVTELSITNPSPCYEASVVMIPRMTARIQVMGLSHWELRSRILRVETGVENTVPVGGGMLPGPDTIQRIGVINGFPRQRRDVIPPGATATYHASMFGFDGDGTFSSVNITMVIMLSTTSPF